MACFFVVKKTSYFSLALNHILQIQQSVGGDRQWPEGDGFSVEETLDL